MAEIPEILENLPQYHFERDEFVKAFYDVFDDEQVDEVIQACSEERYDGGFLMYYAEDEYYIIHLPSGTIVNWYKHLGRTNTCNRPGFTLDDLRAFLEGLKSELFG